MSWYGNDFPYTAQGIAMNAVNKSGVYVVWRTDTTIYVGESNDLARSLLALFSGLHQSPQATLLRSTSPHSYFVRVRSTFHMWHTPGSRGRRNTSSLV